MMLIKITLRPKISPPTIKKSPIGHAARTTNAVSMRSDVETVITVTFFRVI